MSGLKTLSREDWQRHSEAWEVSGLTQHAYCAQEGLAHRRFVYHHNRRLRLSKQGDLNFIEVPRAQVLKKSDDFSLQLILPNGIRVGVDGAVDLSLLQEVLKVAGAMPC